MSLRILGIPIGVSTPPPEAVPLSSPDPGHHARMMFRVWAPGAHTMELSLRGKRWGMRRAENGWWEVEAGAVGGDDYAYFVDGEGPFPDPRSPYQPAGVDGPSRVVDHEAFEWNDARWSASPLPDWVIYELHVGTFTSEGTFDAAIGKLDHLVDLGVTAVELCPVNEYPGDHGWGYDGVDLYAPHHAYGGPDGLKRLVDACHARGLATILDVVYNHLGPAGNYLPRFGPYFTGAYSTPWGDAVNLDEAHSDHVRAFFIDNALMWLDEYHFDALRLDAVHAFLDRSAVHFLEEMAIRVDELERRLGTPKYLIAESDLHDPQVVRPRDEHGMGIDAQWNDDFHHALHVSLTGEQDGYYQDFRGLPDLAKALGRAFVLDGRYSRYRGRRHGRAPEGLPGHSFLAYMQNHDQVGNRARGERISHLVPLGLVKTGAALVLTSPFVPLIFQGEEWAASTPFQYFTDHPDAELGRAVREGRRTEFAAFGWDPEEVPDPQDRATFRRSKLDWAELAEGEHRDMVEWYRSLIRLRKETPELRDGAMHTLRTTFDADESWLVVERGPITIACNLARQARLVPLPEGLGAPVIASDTSDGDALPAESVTIWRR